MNAFLRKYKQYTRARNGASYKQMADGMGISCVVCHPNLSMRMGMGGPDYSIGFFDHTLRHVKFSSQVADYFFGFGEFANQLQDFFERHIVTLKPSEGVENGVVDFVKNLLILHTLAYKLF